MNQSPWFARVGLPLTDADLAEIGAMLCAEPLLDRAEIACADNWLELARVNLAQDWDSSWWEFEEDERQRLWVLAAERLSEDQLFAHLAALNDALATAVRHDAESAAARARMTDPRLIRAAAGAALLAAQQNTLAELAGMAATHYFSRKWVLFTRGRWPLGLHQGRYVVF